MPPFSALERLRKRCRASRQLRYGDFVGAPRETLLDLLAWTGHDTKTFGFLEGNRATLNPGHGIFGNPLRSTEGPLEIKQDRGWVEGLSGLQRTLVTLLTLPLLHRYRYLG